MVPFNWDCFWQYHLYLVCRLCWQVRACQSKEFWANIKVVELRPERIIGHSLIWSAQLFFALSGSGQNWSDTFIRARAPLRTRQFWPHEPFHASLREQSCWVWMFPQPWSLRDHLSFAGTGWKFIHCTKISLCGCRIHFATFRHNAQAKQHVVVLINQSSCKEDDWKTQASFFFCQWTKHEAMTQWESEEALSLTVAKHEPPESTVHPDRTLQERRNASSSAVPARLMTPRRARKYLRKLNSKVHFFYRAYTQLIRNVVEISYPGEDDKRDTWVTLSFIFCFHCRTDHADLLLFGFFGIFRSSSQSRRLQFVSVVGRWDNWRLMYEISIDPNLQFTIQKHNSLENIFQRTCGQPVFQFLENSWNDCPAYCVDERGLCLPKVNISTKKIKKCPWWHVILIEIVVRTQSFPFTFLYFARWLSETRDGWIVLWTNFGQVLSKCNTSY